MRLVIDLTEMGLHHEACSLQGSVALGAFDVGFGNIPEQE